MKILFVDDEPRILEGIERMLFHLTDEWDIICTESGEAALEILDNESCQVLVTDMRMPGMDGAALLQEVCVHHPDVIRIILSGHAELESALRVVPVAHQFLTKPCAAETLVETVVRSCRLHKTLKNRELRKLIGKLKNLPSVPRIYSELGTALMDPAMDAQGVAQIISQDPAMCAKVLQLVNSSFFTRAAHISDISQAVVLLGFQMIKNLVLSVEIFHLSANTPKLPEEFHIEELQRHALSTALIAKDMFSGRLQVDDAFMGAMLHDIGKLILASEAPWELDNALKLATEETLPVFVAEQRLMGVSHAEIGAYLLGMWGLPYPIVEAVANHHNPMQYSQCTTFGIPEAVHLANDLVNGAEIDSGYLEDFGVTQKLAAWRKQAEDLCLTRGENLL
ncbi:MAG TPA: HDOD domain-containing protein [Gammaproteobacteria bacterium]|nr:HDOD domain-containing protein [Gammaproteobacteria bacterium]